MKLSFYKYQGTGNDFILMDNRDQHIRLSSAQIAFLCHRRFGIGADGLMLLDPEPGADFRMVYYNSDGRASTMCGNGGRCITAFARLLGIVTDRATFAAVDGMHHATIHEDGLVSLEMIDVRQMELYPDHAVLDTGSPHYIQWVPDVGQAAVYRDGKAIRERPEFQPAGINVNFAERGAEGIRVRTYERGVEDETMSCGTGVTAAAIASAGRVTGNFLVRVDTPGGRLHVSFSKAEPDKAEQVILKGPAILSFRGEIDI